MTRASNGFTLIELLLAMGILIAVMGAVFALANPAQGVFQSQPEIADLQQRLRVAITAVQRDLLMAGAGTSTTWPSRGPLVMGFAPVLPYRAGDSRADPSAGVFFRADTITVVSVPATTAQATIARSRGGGASLDLDLVGNCGTARDLVCGFSPGMRVLLASPDGRWDVADVTGVTGTGLVIDSARPLASAYGGGDAIVAEVASHTYYLKTDARAATFQLMHYDGRVTDLPVVDHVVSLRFAYFGEPRPPALTGVDLLAERGPWTTYGPKPPPLGRDIQDDPWAAGENCAFAVVDGVHVPRLAHLPPTDGSLVALAPPLLTDGPWCPDPLAASRYDADLLRVRRVQVTMRVQVGAAALRGPAGLLFTRGGTASSSERLVPDQEIRFDVSPRNLSVGR